MINRKNNIYYKIYKDKLKKSINCNFVFDNLLQKKKNTIVLLTD